MHCFVLTGIRFELKLNEKWGVVDKGGDKSPFGG